MRKKGEKSSRVGEKRILDTPFNALMGFGKATLFERPAVISFRTAAYIAQ